MTAPVNKPPRGRVLIEFTKDVEQDGEVIRRKGERLYVDKASAESFVGKKKVAKKLDGEAAEKAAKEKAEAPEATGVVGGVG